MSSQGLVGSDRFGNAVLRSNLGSGINTSSAMNSVLGTSRNDMLGRTYIVDKDQSKYMNMTVELLQCLD